MTSSRKNVTFILFTHFSLNARYIRTFFSRVNQQRKGNRHNEQKEQHEYCQLENKQTNISNCLEGREHITWEVSQTQFQSHHQNKSKIISRMLSMDRCQTKVREYTIYVSKCQQFLFEHNDLFLHGCQFIPQLNILFNVKVSRFDKLPEFGNNHSTFHRRNQIFFGSNQIVGEGSVNKGSKVRNTKKQEEN